MEYVIARATPLSPATGGRQRLTVADTAGGVALTIPTGAIMAACRLETAQIRFTVDTTAPTSTTGQILEVGETLELQTAKELANFRAIRTGATSGTLDIEYFTPNPAS